MTSSPLTVADARALAREAYIYGFPLVDNYRVMHSFFVDRDGPEFKAPWNTIHNEVRVYTPEDRTIQTPNSDTPYSQLGTDLRREPLVLTVPEVEDGRYYSLQFIDLYTFNYAYVGSRTTGNGAGRFLLVGPGWEGEPPEGVDGVIRCETEIGWIQYRTQLVDGGDLDGVRAVQAGYGVEPLSSILGTDPPEHPGAVDWTKPVAGEAERSSPVFFEVLDFLLRFCPVHPSESGLRARFGRLGIGTGNGFRVDALEPEIRDALAQGMADAWATFEEFKRTEVDTGLRTAADGFGTRDFLAGDFLGRMASAVLGIYGNSKEEALYPAYYVDTDGEKLDASTHRYTLRFPPDALPPVQAFWSLTMYELPSSLLVANPLDRFLINSPMLESLVRDEDGGVTLHVQRDTPGPDREANWLPAPDGPFWMVLRLYWPDDDALEGRWTAPPVRKAAAAGGQGNAVPVTTDNFIRAESDLYMRSVVGRGAFGTFDHNREPTPVDDQTVIRMNRDTLYSAAVFDLDAGPVTLTLPDPGDRFLSMQVINQNHHTPLVAYGAGRHTLDREEIGTRYVITAIRILVDPQDPEDLAEVVELQNAIDIEQHEVGVFEVPDWDLDSQKVVRDLLLRLASLLPDTKGMFGTEAEVDPVRHLIGSAMGWGGNPERDALYLNVTPTRNDGRTVHRLAVRDVPVDGFWSISVYNADGFFQRNDREAYSLNSRTAERADDGSVTIQFGGCDGETPNCLPIVDGWNYMVRLYRPRPEVLDGSWTFPEARAVE